MIYWEFRKKENEKNGEPVFAVSVHNRVKLKENLKRDKYLHLDSDQKIEHEIDGDTNCNWSTWNGPQKLGKRAGRVENWRNNRDHPN